MVNVVHVIVGRHPGLVTVGIQADLLVPDPKSNIVWLIRIRFDPKQYVIERLRSS